MAGIDETSVNEPILSAAELVEVRKSYGRSAAAVEALRGISVRFPKSTFTAVMGPSGSGKSTLLLCAAGLETPTAGEVLVAGRPLSRLGEKQRTMLRRDQVGFVFQSFQLIDSLTAAQNVALPLRLAGRRPDRARVQSLLAAVGLTGRGGHRPNELSGGEQQRVAIARAMAPRPAVIFADEPTGALDSRNGRRVLTLLRELVDDTGQTIVLVTHDPIAASCADRVIFLSDGVTRGILERPGAAAVAARMTELDRLAATGSAGTIQ